MGKAVLFFTSALVAAASSSSEDSAFSLSDVESSLTSRFPDINLNVLLHIGTSPNPVEAFTQNVADLDAAISRLRSDLNSLPFEKDWFSYVSAPKYNAKTQLGLKLDAILEPSHSVSEAVLDAVKHSLAAIAITDTDNRLFLAFNEKLDAILSNPLFASYEDLQNQGNLLAYFFGNDAASAPTVDDLNTELKSLQDQLNALPGNAFLSPYQTKNQAKTLLTDKLNSIKQGRALIKALNQQVAEAVNAADSDKFIIFNNNLDKFVTSHGPHLPLLAAPSGIIPAVDPPNNRLILNLLTELHAIVRDLELANDQPSAHNAEYLVTSAVKGFETAVSAYSSVAEFAEFEPKVEKLMVAAGSAVLRLDSDKESYRFPVFNDMIKSINSIKSILASPDGHPDFPVEDLREEVHEAASIIRAVNGWSPFDPLLALFKFFKERLQNAHNALKNRLPVRPEQVEVSSGTALSDLEDEMKQRFPDIDLDLLAFIGKSGTPIATLKKKSEDLKELLDDVTRQIANLPYEGFNLQQDYPKHNAKLKLQAKLDKLLAAPDQVLSEKDEAATAIEAIKAIDTDRKIFEDINALLKEVQVHPVFRNIKKVDEVAEQLAARVVDKGAKSLTPEKIKKLVDGLRNKLQSAADLIAKLPSDSTWSLSNVYGNAKNLLEAKLRTIQSGQRPSSDLEDEVEKAVDATLAGYISTATENEFTEANKALNNIIGGKVSKAFIPLLKSNADKPESIPNLVQNRVVLRTFSFLHPIMKKLLESPRDLKKLKKSVREYEALPHRWTGFDKFLPSIKEEVGLIPTLSDMQKRRADVIDGLKTLQASKAQAPPEATASPGPNPDKRKKSKTSSKKQRASNRQLSFNPANVEPEQCNPETGLSWKEGSRCLGAVLKRLVGMRIPANADRTSDDTKRQLEEAADFRTRYFGAVIQFYTNQNQEPKQFTDTIKLLEQLKERVEQKSTEDFEIPASFSGPAKGMANEVKWVIESNKLRASGALRAVQQPSVLQPASNPEADQDSNGSGSGNGGSRGSPEDPPGGSAGGSQPTKTHNNRKRQVKNPGARKNNQSSWDKPKKTPELQGPAECSRNTGETLKACVKKAYAWLTENCHNKDLLSTFIVARSDYLTSLLTLYNESMRELEKKKKISQSERELKTWITNQISVVKRTIGMAGLNIVEYLPDVPTVKKSRAVTGQVRPVRNVAKSCMGA